MTGVIPEHTGLITFLQNVTAHRNNHTDEEKEEARHKAYYQLLNNGVVAVGDIANTTDTLDIRSLDELHFHTFIESIGFTEARAELSLGFAVKNYKVFAAQLIQTKVLRQSITPHAPYSVSRALFRLIDAHHKGGLIAIHNQESEAESQFYRTKEGDVRELLKGLGIDDSLFHPTGLSSIQSFLEWMTPGRPFVFVHNTYTTEEDIIYAHSRSGDVAWCLCPNANLYIENRLPNIDLLMQHSSNLCIGTDSLASNHQLSIMAELYSIHRQYPHIGWETLLSWATSNGARALKMSDIVGSIEVGKTPGIVQVTGIDGDGLPRVVRVG
jgi:cytosine/adenosine deaminase-related metal-dependent hydrolase